MHLSLVEVSLVFMKFYSVQPRFMNIFCELEAVVISLSDFMLSRTLILLSLESIYFAVDPILMLRNFSLLCNFDVCGRPNDGLLCFKH